MKESQIDVKGKEYSTRKTKHNINLDISNKTKDQDSCQEESLRWSQRRKVNKLFMTKNKRKRDRK